MSEPAVSGAPRTRDSRRLTGANLLLEGPGAILEVETGNADPARLAAAWERALDRMLPELGWTGAARATRTWEGGLALCFAAPIDSLYVATEVNEWAFSAACAELAGEEARPAFAAEAARLREARDGEANPAMIALRDAAEAHDVTFLWDDRRYSVGLGVGSLAWPVAEATAARRVRWSRRHDIPVALVTGTNGKSTTVRLLGAMVAAAGRVPGVTSTDRVEVGDQVVAVGDYSGPNGARTVLRDRRVEYGILEVARGGIMRRGLPVPRAHAAVVLNVARDHLGEYGIHDVESLADAKMVVTRAVRPDGMAVLNADDARVRERGERLSCPLLWFTLDSAQPVVRAHRDAGGSAAWLEQGALWLAHAGMVGPVVRVADIPVTLAGAARHNVANALAAMGAAAALGLTREAMRAGLTGFASSPERNPGRTNIWEFGGARVIVDFAHNPHGIEALAVTAAAMPARRRALVIGQAGDRTDHDIGDFARAAWAMHPDRVFIKEMEKYLRGRDPGVIPAMLAAAFREEGAEDRQLEHHPSELDAVRAALAWAREGDLLLLTTHAQRTEVLGLMKTLAAARWQPGTPLPDQPLSAP